MGKLIDTDSLAAFLAKCRKAFGTSEDVQANAEAIEAEASRAQQAEAAIRETVQANAEAIEGCTSGLVDMREDVDGLMNLSRDYMAAAWEPQQLSPAAVKTAGDPSAIDFDWYLIDHTSNDAAGTVPVGRLRRNNLLRFEDGTFAPAVGITADMRDECMGHDIYFQDGELYAEAGAFDPEAFYRDHCSWEKDGDGVTRLRHPDLYKDTGDNTMVKVGHCLMPWETAETRYSQMLGCGCSLYMLQNVKGRSGRVWNFISSTPRSYDGQKAVGLKPTAMSACPVAVIIEDGVRKSRSFFFAHDGEEAVYGNGGAGGTGQCTMFRNTGRTMPASSVMTQITTMQYARNSNVGVQSPTPFAEGGWHMLNTFITWLEIKYATRNLHANDMFGSGISSNDSCSGEATWRSNGGVRARKAGDGGWTYGRWNTAPTFISKDGEGASVGNWSSFINNYRPKEACMESQLAASFAVESGVAEGDLFEMYGQTYTWSSVQGADSLADGRMNAVIHSIRTGTAHAYDTEGNDAVFEIEASLRMSLYEGASLSGDTLVYWGGGLEIIGEAAGSSTPRTGDPVKMYFEPEQTEWVYDTGTVHNDGAEFTAQSQYPMVDTGTCIGDGPSLEDHQMLPWKKVKGSSIAQGMCRYVWNNVYWSTVVGASVRLGLRFRGLAYHGFCAPRSLSAHYAVSTSSTAYCGSAQVRLQTGAATPQAEGGSAANEGV